MKDMHQKLMDDLVGDGSYLKLLTTKNERMGYWLDLLQKDHPEQFELLNKDTFFAADMFEDDAVGVEEIDNYVKSKYIK